MGFPIGLGGNIESNGSDVENVNGVVLVVGWGVLMQLPVSEGVVLVEVVAITWTVVVGVVLTEDVAVAWRVVVGAEDEGNEHVES